MMLQKTFQAKLFRIIYHLCSRINWYNPNKNYYKFYLTEKGVYRITFEELILAGVPLGAGVSSNKLELFSDGQLVPIDVVDDGDSTFNSGDYFQFVGHPASPSPNCTMNIYNLTNVYWFSYQSDSSGYFIRPKTDTRNPSIKPTIHLHKQYILKLIQFMND